MTMNRQIPFSRKGRKVEQVLSGARQIFMRDGFEAANVDDIAKAAGVSKATLYSYFSDKRQLFREVVQAECDRMSVEILSKLDNTEPVRCSLKTAALGLATFLVSSFSQRVFRICLAERDRFPELGQAYYECGPSNGHDQMVAHLREAVRKQELAIEDIDMAAYQFAELCKARIFTRVAFGVQTEFSEGEIEQVAEQAVETFMARFAPARAV